MNQYIIEAILGLVSGIFLGITGIAPTGLILILLEYFKIGEYKKNLGAILLINFRCNFSKIIFINNYLFLIFLLLSTFFFAIIFRTLRRTIFINILLIFFINVFLILTLTVF